MIYLKYLKLLGTRKMLEGGKCPRKKKLCIFKAMIALQQMEYVVTMDFVMRVLGNACVNKVGME